MRLVSRLSSLVPRPHPLTRKKIGSLVPLPRVPHGEKRTGERSRISWAYYPKRVMTNEIARSVIIM